MRRTYIESKLTKQCIVMNQKDSNFTFKISSGLFTVEEKHNSVRYLITSAAT